MKKKKKKQQQLFYITLLRTCPDLLDNRKDRISFDANTTRIIMLWDVIML